MSQYELVMRTGPAPGKVFPLSNNEFYIGRDVNNEIVINDTEVSRRHCHFVLTSGGYTIEDLGSTNGTFIDQNRITGVQLLKPGAMVRLGDNVTLLYQVAGAGAQATVAARGAAPPPPPPPPPSPPVQQSAPPAASYAGQVPASPPKKSGLLGNRTLLIGCGILLVVGACVAIGVMWYIDSNYLWCDVFGGMIPACR